MEYIVADVVLYSALVALVIRLCSISDRPIPVARKRR